MKCCKNRVCQLQFRKSFASISLFSLELFPGEGMSTFPFQVNGYRFLVSELLEPKQSIKQSQMCLPVGTHIWNQGLNKCKVGPQEKYMVAEDGLSRASFHTGSESMGVFWLALVSSPPGKYCQWFGVGVRTCCLLIPTHSALLWASMELWPQHRCAWSEMCEPGIFLFSLLNSFIRAASFHSPWQGILTLCLDSQDTKSPLQMFSDPLFGSSQLDSAF